MSVQFACSNYSQDSATPWLWFISPYSKVATLTVSGFLILFMLIGIPWNLLLFVIIIKKHLFKQPAILLLLNLAITNLLLCMIVMPMIIIPALAGEFIFGSSDYARCRVCHLTLIMSILLLMSVHNIALLSLDRFLYVKKPLQYQNIVTLKRVIAVLVLCWLVFTAFSILPVFGVGLVTFTEVLSACVLTWAVKGLNIHYVYYWVFVVCACLTPVTILVITNTWMICIMRKSLSRGYLRSKKNSFGSWGTSTRSLQLREKHTKDQVRLVQIFGSLFLSSVLTWLPLVIAISMVTAANLFVLEFTVFAFLSILSQPVIHPILQVLLLNDIRMVVVKPCNVLIKCLRKPSKTSSTSLDSKNEDESSGVAKHKCERCLRCCGVFDRCAFALVNYNI